MSRDAHGGNKKRSVDDMLRNSRKLYRNPLPRPARHDADARVIKRHRRFRAKTSCLEAVWTLDTLDNARSATFIWFVMMNLHVLEDLARHVDLKYSVNNSVWRITCASPKMAYSSQKKFAVWVTENYPQYRMYVIRRGKGRTYDTYTAGRCDDEEPSRDHSRMDATFKQAAENTDNIMRGWHSSKTADRLFADMNKMMSDTFPHEKHVSFTVPPIDLSPIDLSTISTPDEFDEWITGNTDAELNAFLTNMLRE